MKILDKLLSLIKPISNPNVTMGSLVPTITSAGVKLSAEQLMTNERVKRKMQQMSSRPVCRDCGEAVTIGSCRCGNNNF